MKTTFVWASFSLVMGLLLVGEPSGRAHAQELDPRLKDFDIEPMLRFDDLQSAEERRERLVRTIWSDGLPSTRPKVTKGLTDCPEMASVNRDLIDRIDLYDVDVAGMDYHSLVYVAYPKRKVTGPARLAIVQGGHMPEGPENYLIAGLSDSIDHLLREGFVVATIQMPLAGWNRDADGKLPSGKEFKVERRLTGGHDELFAAVEPELKGEAMKFFLEPIVQATNELFAEHPERAGLLMVGLSGGGWTAHMSAAVDPRIDVSVPVAGALPLYARPFSRGSKGDAEQEYAPIYREEDTDGDGVLDTATGICSWIEVFALGGISPDNGRPRHQVQVVNLYDSCCFGGTAHRSYADQLTGRVQQLGTGSFKVHVDDTHRGHMISKDVLEEVVQPLIDAPPFAN